MELETEKQKTIEMLTEALDELRQLQRGVSSWVRDYTIDGKQDAAICAALWKLNEAIDQGQSLLEQYNSEDRDV